MAEEQHIPRLLQLFGPFFFMHLPPWAHKDLIQEHVSEEVSRASEPTGEDGSVYKSADMIPIRSRYIAPVQRW